MIDPAWIALGGTIFGGVGLKVAEQWLGRSRIRIDDASKIRDELRLDNAAMREEIKDLEADRDRWQGLYYDLRDSHVGLKAELQVSLAKVKDKESG